MPGRPSTPPAAIVSAARLNLTLPALAVLPDPSRLAIGQPCLPYIQTNPRHSARILEIPQPQAQLHFALLRRPTHGGISAWDRERQNPAGEVRPSIS
jgi:hypothetical protein